MSLVFAGITPHPPLLIPTIGKEKLADATRTKNALEAMEQELYLSKPQIIIIITPHCGLYEDSFTVNANTTLTCGFEKFGDLTTKKQFAGSPDMAAKIAHASRGKDLPIQLISEEMLDHGAAVPLFYLTAHHSNVKILPVGYCGLNAMEHFRFGELISDVINESNTRVAVIASGDLSHDLDTPGGEAGKAFDAELQRLVANRAIGSLIQLEEAAVQIDQCGYRSILVLMGVLNKMNYTFNQSAYEHPYGVGYLTGTFAF